MFRKFIFGKLNVEPFNAVLDRSTSAGEDSRPEHDTPSWLASAAEPDPGLRVRQERLLACELFIQTRLAPYLEGGSSFDETRLEELLVEFKASRPGPGADFDTSQVMGMLLNRFECHLFEDPAEVSGSLEMDVVVFSSLAGIDLQRVDEAVRNRMRIG